MSSGVTEATAVGPNGLTPAVGPRNCAIIKCPSHCARPIWPFLGQGNASLKGARLRRARVSIAGVVLVRERVCEPEYVLKRLADRLKRTHSWLLERRTVFLNHSIVRSIHHLVQPTGHTAIGLRDTVSVNPS